ncbi:MAG: winged helix-turn-helix domain-containing protein [Alphaproteobacteria bacterium]
MAAQGFATAPPGGRITRRHVLGVIDRLGLLQIDSVNVLVRSHYLPLFSRLGGYPLQVLDGLAWGRRGRALFEYWGHGASLIPLASQPLFRWRMARAHQGEPWGGLGRFGAERRAFIDAVLGQVHAEGPLGVSDLVDGGRSTGSWWGWSDGKRALEWLFWAGLVTTAARRGFERLYDLPERVLPPAVLAAPTPAPADAQRALVRRAIRALGVATEAELRDYFRLSPADNRARLAELLEAGEIRPVRIEGGGPLSYIDPAARLPRRVDARALLSPFDPVVWQRDRAERLFGFRYRIGLYTPSHARTHGYYVLPFLMGERLVARVDLKADRKAGVLRALALHGEAAIVTGRVAADGVAAALAAELERMASWLGLDAVAVGTGDLARPVRAELGARFAGRLGRT